MAILDFAAHTLDYLSVNEGHHDEETGDFIKGSEEWTEGYCKCDIVPAGKANQIQIPDGSLQTYSYTIYNLPRDCRRFEFGDRIRIHFFDKDDDVREFKVLGFHRYQLQCKLWV